MKDYYDDAGKPAKNRIRHGDERGLGADTHDTIQGGDDVKYFMVRGVSEGDRRVTRCGMVR
jgi:hypothetical protein